MSSARFGQVNGGRTFDADGDLKVANTYLLRLESIETQRLGTDPRSVRDRIASRLNALPGTLENVRRFRLKTVPSWLIERLRSALIESLQHEVRRLEAEIALHRQAGDRPDADEIFKAATALENAKKILNGERR